MIPLWLHINARTINSVIHDIEPPLSSNDLLKHPECTDNVVEVTLSVHPLATVREALIFREDRRKDVCRKFTRLKDEVAVLELALE